MKHVVIALLVCILAACATPAPTPAPESKVGLANPASTYCVQQGGQIDLRKDAAGNVNGVCVFKDGRECEEWALFRDQRCVAPAALKP
jgi:putative hemolysin